MEAIKKVFNKLAPPPPKSDDGRDKWPSRTSFILASCSGVVGMGNMLRYPSTVYNNSGLQWFVPYLLAVLVLAIPALTLEVAAGNAYRGGTVTAYNKISRRMRGIGFSLNYVGLVVSIYFVPILAWGMVYFQKSFTSPLPWAGDTQEYFMREVVSAVDPEEDGAWLVYPGIAFDGRLVGWNAFLFFIVWLCMFRGTGLTGRVVYITLGLPLVMFIVLIGRGVSLPNAGRGIKMYFAEWHSWKLSETQLWQDAVGQVFYSTGVGFGFYTAYASYNRQNANAPQDAVIIATMNASIEVLLAFAVFGIVGFLGMTPEETGPIGSYDIGFMTYPEAFVQMPGSNFFSALFFFTLMLVGTSSTFAMLDAVMTLIMDAPFAKRWGRPTVATILVFVVFLLSLPNCTQFGYYYLDGVDRWINNVGLVAVVWAECVMSTTLYRYEDVVGQVGMPAFATFNTGYFGSQLLSVIVGHTAGPAAGAGAGFGFFFVCLAISLVISKHSDAPGVPKLMSKSKMMVSLYYLAFYSGNMLRHDLNSVIGIGKNWHLPRIWAPLLRFFSGPVLAVIFSLAYPMFQGLMHDPLHVYGFIIAHFLLLWIIVGMCMPRWFDVFIIHERRDDWKQPYAPNVLRDTTEGEIADGMEAATASPTLGSGSQQDLSETLGEKKEDDMARDGVLRDGVKGDGFDQGMRDDGLRRDDGLTGSFDDARRDDGFRRDDTLTKDSPGIVR